jgi:osmotically-inducible protein OsmY
MATDLELKSALLEKIDAIPSINTSDIEVFVNDGIVKLNGEVSNNQLRFQIERSARRVAGIRGLEMNIRSHQHMGKKNSSKMTPPLNQSNRH